MANRVASAVADTEAVATEARVVLVVAAARSRVVGEASGVGAAVGVAAVGVLAPHLTKAETAPQARRWPDGARRPCCGVLTANRRILCTYPVHFIYLYLGTRFYI